MQDQLVSASERGDVEEVRALLENKANVNSGNQYGDPIVAACTEGNMDVVRVLLEYKANTRVSIDFWTPLMGVVGYGKKSLELTKILLEAKASVNARSDYGCTPLVNAGSVEVMKLLLDSKACVDTMDNERSTPLVEWIERGNLEAVQVLLDYGADAELEGYTTPLLAAMKKGNVEIVEALLAKGADVNLANRHGETPLGKATELGHSSVVELLTRQTIS